MTYTVCVITRASNVDSDQMMDANSHPACCAGKDYQQSLNTAFRLRRAYLSWRSVGVTGRLPGKVGKRSGQQFLGHTLADRVQALCHV